MNLTDKKYWDNEYTAGDTIKAVQNPLYRFISNFAKKIVGTEIQRMAESYDEYRLFEILKKSVGNNRKGSSVIEVGSAPGSYVIKIGSIFDFIPYGVEYTEAGAEICKKNFAQHGFDPENVYLDDFLSEKFQNIHFEKYDIVLSRGFIEHFKNPDDVVKAHIALLKPGGHLIVSIPNLRGVYWLWTYIFNNPQLPLHNIDIMKLSEFRKLFENKEIQEKWCGYIGTFSFWLFTFEKIGMLKKFVHQILIIAQLMLNVVFRFLFKERGMETSLFSPNLLFIGKKCE